MTSYYFREHIMKKFLLLALGMFALTLVAGWSVFWFIQARQVKNTVLADMENLSPTLGVIETQGVSVSGFPFNMVLTLHRPKITLNLAATLNLMHKRLAAEAGNSAAVLTAPRYPEGTLVHQREGDVVVGVNAFSDRLHLSMTGGDTTQIMQNGESTLTRTEMEGAAECFVRFERNLVSVSQQMWDVAQFFSAQNMRRELRELDCALPASTTRDATSGDIASHIGASSLYLENIPTDERIRSTVRVDMNDYEMLPAGDALHRKLLRAVTPIGEEPAPFTMSSYGKQSLALDASFDMPDAGHSFTGRKVAIDIRRFEMASAAGTSTGRLKFSQAPQGNADMGEVDFELTSDFLPAQTEIARAGVAQLSKEMVLPEGTDADAAQALIFDAMPDVTRLGTIRAALRAGFARDMVAKTASANIGQLALSTRDYGVNMAGSASVAQAALLPALNLTLDCRNCFALIDTLSGYLVRLEAARPLLLPTVPNTLSVTPAQREGIKSLLGAVGVPQASSANDLRFVIQSSASGVSINGKMLAELIGLFQTHLGDAMAPGAQASPPPQDPQP